jgi:hypothetical protein
MKALTLTQPWATLIALDAKRIETRSWGTGWRGDLAIHAGKGLKPVGGKGGLGLICNREPFRSTLAAGGIQRMHLGAIVAVAELVDCVPGDPEKSEELQGRFRERPNERAFGGYGPGRVAWLLAAIRPLPVPVVTGGAQGLWTLPEELAEAVREQLT